MGDEGESMCFTRAEIMILRRAKIAKLRQNLCLMRPLRCPWRHWRLPVEGEMGDGILLFGHHGHRRALLLLKQRPPPCSCFSNFSRRGALSFADARTYCHTWTVFALVLHVLRLPAGLIAGDVLLSEICEKHEKQGLYDLPGVAFGIWNV